MFEDDGAVNHHDVEEFSCGDLGEEVQGGCTPALFGATVSDAKHSPSRLQNSVIHELAEQHALMAHDRVGHLRLLIREERVKVHQQRVGSDREIVNRHTLN